MYLIIIKDVISHSLRVMNYTNKLCKEFKISKKEKTNYSSIATWYREIYDP